MGCCDCLGKTVLVAINILFSLIGIALLVAGCIVRFGSDLMEQYLQDLYEAFSSALEKAGVNSGIGNLNIGDLLGDATLAFIIIGAFFFVIGICGCIGACCKVKCLLVVYAIVLIVVFIVEVVFVILLFTIKPTIDGWLRDPVRETLEDQYTGPNGTDAFTLAVNFVMHQFECCGIYNYSEFANAQKWVKSSQADKVPFFCCVNATLANTDCITNPNPNNSYIEKGCFDAFEDELMKHEDIMIGVGAGVAAIQLILIIFAFVVCCKERKKNDDDSYDDDDIPIQPYRENKNSVPYSDMFHQGHANSGYRHDGRGPSAPHERDYGPDPYRGQTDYYRGPPDGYQAGYQKRR